MVSLVQPARCLQYLLMIILIPANEGRVGRAGERGKTWAGRKGERVDGLRGRGSSAI